MRAWAGIVGVALGLGLFGPALADCKLEQFATLPVTMEGGKAATPARINGADVLFVVDSGTTYSSLSPASAAQYRLPLSPAPYGLFVSAIGGGVSVSIATVRDFGLSNATLHDVRFITGGGDLTAPAVGVIGQNVLGLGDVDYDLGGGMVHLMRPRGCGSQPLAYWSSGKPYSMLQIEPRANDTAVTQATVLVNGVRMRAVFDTGASTSLITRRAAERAGVRIDTPGVTRASLLRGAGAHTAPIWLAPFDRVKIGDEEVRNTHLYVADTGGGDDVDVRIGVDFFLSHRVYVANGQGRMYFTYSGGPVFDLSHPPTLVAAPGAAPAAAAEPETASEPKDAEEFSRRGEARAARRDLAGAEADLDRAVELQPGEARYLSERAEVRLALRQPLLAMSDLDAALKLKGDDAEAHAVRAALRIAGHDPQGAREDVDAASAAAAKEADLRLRLAALYIDLDTFDLAVEQDTLWIAAHGDDSRMEQALNERCRARALTGAGLDQALSDCNRAVRLGGRSAQALDSRGLVHLRRAEYALAIADYDAALAAEPKLAWSLYGRGVAELRTGDKARGDADLAASAALAPRLADRAAKLGLSPPP